MIFQGIDVSGSFDITGSFVTAKGDAFPLTASSVQGDMFFHTTLDTMYVFTTSGSWTPIGDITSSTPPPPPDLTPNIEYLVVAGGGGSAYDGGGGGGAGGFLSSSIDDVASGSVMTITVGAGGNVASNGTNSSLASTSGTSFTTVTSTGGGTGAGAGNSYTAGDGGSGGGGAGGQYNNPGGSGIVGQGHDGGTSGTSGGGATYPGSGGGGAGAAGGEGVNSGGSGKPGGIGKQTSITGTATYYAGGGGGASGGGGGGAGGSGGGGAGGNSAQGTAGTANTGGGAGGSNVTAGVTGGSGVVILAYPTGSATGIGGRKTSRSDGYFVHQFNESGTFTLGGANEYPIANNENFEIVTYTGNGGTQTISGVDFQSDFIWVKNRTDGGHRIYDVQRGLGGTEEYLVSNTNAESVVGGTGAVTDVSSTGFTVGSGNAHNGSGDEIVAYCWKAGGTATSNTDGSITSTVSANTAAGFSIVKYTSTGTNGSTIGHGLSSTPELIIIKCESTTGNWIVYTSASGTGEYLYLNGSGEGQTASWIDVNSSVFTLNNTYQDANTNTRTYMAYCFHSVSGYSKFGSYEGTSSTGNTTTVGFKPKFVMLKGIDGTENWILHDTVSSDGSVHIRPNSGNAEDNGANEAITINNTGFAPTTSGAVQINTSGRTYFYWAIA